MHLSPPQQFGNYYSNSYPSIAHAKALQSIALTIVLQLHTYTLYSVVRSISIVSTIFSSSAQLNSNAWGPFLTSPTGEIFNPGGEVVLQGWILSPGGEIICSPLHSSKQ
jgi:hypothetical protein